MLGPAQKPEYFTVPSEGGAAFGDHGLPLGRSEGIIRGHLLHGASVFLFAANLGLLGSYLFPVVATALQSFFQRGQPC